MGYIRRLDSNADIQAFPGATFEIANGIPFSQCSEAIIESDTATTTSVIGQLHDPGKFAGYSLIGKICTITASVGGNTGNFNIGANTDTNLLLDPNPGDGDPVSYYIHDGPEELINGDNGTTSSAPFKLTEVGKFTGFTLNGKICIIHTNPGGNVGTFNIINNTNDILNLVQNPGNGGPTVYTVVVEPELRLTRNLASFAAYIHAAGYAYTIKGGKLYTDMPNGLLKNACSILFDPLT